MIISIKLSAIFLLIIFIIVFSNLSLSQWYYQQTPVSVNLHGIYFITPEKGFAVGQYGTILKTTNGGNTWLFQVPQITTEFLNSVIFSDSMNGWICGDNGTILKTYDGGDTWNFEYPSFYTNYYGLTLIKEGSTVKVWTVGGRFSAGTSVIQGRNSAGDWTTQFFDYLGLLRQVCFTDLNNGWVAGNFGYLLYTNNGGSSWIVKHSGINVHFNGVSFLNSQIGLVVGESGTIIRTSDGGNTWNTIQSPNNNLLFDVRFRPDGIAFAVGVNGTILLSTDLGITWKNQDSPITNHFERIFFINKEAGWAVGHVGGVVYTKNAGGVLDVKEISHVATNFSLYQNYPNPFNPSTIIKYEIPKSDHVTLKIYDIFGKEIVTLVDQKEEPGLKTIEYKANNLSSGVYFYRLSTSHFTKIKRFSLIK